MMTIFTGLVDLGMCILAPISGSACSWGVSFGLCGRFPRGQHSQANADSRCEARIAEPLGVERCYLPRRIAGAAERLNEGVLLRREAADLYSTAPVVSFPGAGRGPESVRRTVKVHRRWMPPEALRDPRGRPVPLRQTLDLRALVWRQAPPFCHPGRRGAHLSSPFVPGTVLPN